MYHGCQVQYSGKGILDDRSIARCTPVWVKEQKRSRWESTVYGYKDSVLHVFTCIDVLYRVLIYHVFDHVSCFRCANVCEHFGQGHSENFKNCLAFM